MAPLRPILPRRKFVRVVRDISVRDGLF